MAGSGKGGSSSIASGAKTLLGRLPFAKARAAKASPGSESGIEGFEEHELGLGDALEAKASKAKAKTPREKINVGTILRTAIKKLPVMIACVSVAAFLVLLVLVSILVSRPPKASSAPPATTKEGESLVSGWLAPPGDPLAPRFEMERSDTHAYSAADAAKLGISDDPILRAKLAEKNDEVMESLFGTVP